MADDKTYIETQREDSTKAGEYVSRQLRSELERRKTADLTSDMLKRRSDDYLDESEIKGNYVGSYKSQALSMIKVPGSLIVIAICCTTLIVISALCLIFIPWQQSISGRGKVIIFSPMERPQNLETPIPGRIARWFVRDGQVVEKGEPIVGLDEIDPKFLAPNQLQRLQDWKSALENKREAALARSAALKEQLVHLKDARESSVQSADRKRSQASDKLDAAKQTVTAAQQNLKTAELNLNRIKTLFDKGLRSKRDFELSELDFVKARTELERALNQLEVAEKETQVANLEVAKIAASTNATIQSVSASYNSAMETVANTESEIQKLRIDIGHLQNRITQRILKSPIDGRVVRLLKAGAGETVKSCAQLAVIAPETKDLAVELKVQGNDAPLISTGRPVRLQFAGWPAVQFTGWPSVAVGTFAGRVAVVDAVDDGTGSFRIIVVPDEKAVEENKDQPWPDTKFLRPGSEAHGWVMLNTVSLGFELWRQFNAFPPSLDKSEFEKKTGDIKRKTK